MGSHPVQVQDSSHLATIALEIMNVNEDDEILRKDGKEIRKELKKQIVKIQKERLVEKMLGESKADRVLLNNFKFDGKVKKYLTELPFEEARVEAGCFLLKTTLTVRYGFLNKQKIALKVS